jgi:MerR family transcriptional regulator, thiopeptide resistance regulator
VTKSNPQVYRVKEFAELAGITVRALHHYDRLGLLKPQRTQAGYRMYSLRDLERLEQIVALRFLGIPLRQIKTLLDRSALDLPDALRLQRRVLEDKRSLLDRAINAIRDAEKAMRPGKPADTALLKKIIEVIEMQDNMNWSKQYYSEEAQAKIEERKALWSPELQERVTREWTELFRDVEAAIAQDENPTGPKAQALAARWKKLVEGFTGGDPEMASGLNKLHAHRDQWPQQFQQQMAPFSKPKVWEYMGKAMASCKV